MYSITTVGWPLHYQCKVSFKFSTKLAKGHAAAAGSSSSSRLVLMLVAGCCGCCKGRVAAHTYIGGLAQGRRRVSAPRERAFDRSIRQTMVETGPACEEAKQVEMLTGERSYRYTNFFSEICRKKNFLKKKTILTGRERLNNLGLKMRQCGKMVMVIQNEVKVEGARPVSQ